MAKQDLKNFSWEELKAFLLARNQEAFHASQIFSWIYKKGVEDFDLMSDLSLKLRNFLKENFHLSELEVIKNYKSSDATEKFLFKLEDGCLIESALIPTKERSTICLSSQAGCKFCCKFCASGLGGFKRNLTTGEIVSQALFMIKHSKGKKISHIVFMGTGEPLDNYENVLKAIRIFNSGQALKIGSRRITISTSGVIPGIKKLAQENLQVELSVSLHSGDDKTRNMLMPVNRKYPLEELIAELRRYFIKTHRQVTFEYILIHKLNCDKDSAKQLGRVLNGFDFKLNLVPYNKIKEFDFQPPTKLEVLFFQTQLSRERIRATLRMPRGRDINAACGQLRYYA